MEHRFRVEREIPALFYLMFLFALRHSVGILRGRPMRFLHRRSLVSIFVVCLTLPVLAQNAPSLDQPAPNATVQQGTLTGKERLGPKWTDEQRIDNCKVPVDKRGTKPRSSACPHIPTG
jgi:hypothetical protein